MIHAMMAAALLANAPAAQVLHASPASSPISVSVKVPPGATIVYVSGQLADPVPAAANAPKSYGDTETQTRSVLNKITAALAAQGMTPADVTMMRVYLAAPAGKPMDFAGMMKAYKEVYGTPTQTNKPARVTVQVAALVLPDALVEIEVQAAKVFPR